MMTAALRRTGLLVLTALCIEFLDELVDGVSGAAWPLIRAEFSLTYVQIGILLTLPALVANLIEPLLALLSDLGGRRRLILGGGLAYTAAMLLVAASGGFWTLLAGLLLYHPAAGAFVSLTQTAWMDAEPEQRELNMARWTLSGSLANVLGPLLIGVFALLGAGWRPVYALVAALLLIATGLAWRARGALEGAAVSTDDPDEEPPASLVSALRGAGQALRRREVQRWLLLLECGNLMLDIFRGFVALYFVDVLHASVAQAAFAVTVLTGVGLLGDALLLPLLSRVSGLRYLRLSALLTALLFPAFLLLPWLGAKLALLGLLGLLNAGWYAILQAQLYGSLPGRSGVALALGNVSGMLGGLFPLLLGALAGRFGLGAALWFLMLGPLALLVGLPREQPGTRFPHS
jgi:MFS transporter, FSR family, fosmidomycin resistance protein